MEAVGRRYDLPKGRGGLDLYKRDWMTANHSVVMDGSRDNIGMGLGSLGDASDPNSQVDASGMLDFKSKWQAVKVIFTDFESQVGQKIIDKLNKLESIQQTLVDQGSSDVAVSMQSDIDGVRADLDSYWQCKEAKDDYYDMWVSVAQSVGLAGVRGSMRGVSGLGLLPLLVWMAGEGLYLTYAGLAALTLIAVTGMALYQKYKPQTYVLDQLALPNLTPEARASLDAVAKTIPDQGILQTVGDSITTGVQIAVMIGLVYLGYKAYQSA